MSGIIAQNSGRHTGLVKAASAGGEWTLIQTLTSDGSDDDLSFTSGLDSTYDEYCFIFTNLHAETNDAIFGMNLSIDGGSNYNVTKTSSFFKSYNKEDGSTNGVGYDGGYDLAQVTTYQKLTLTNKNNADDSWSGWMFLYAPASTSSVKHWISRISAPYDTSAADCLSAGYGNTASAVDAITFLMSSGEIQAGSISLYGIG